MNPIKANMVKDVSDYRWSSYAHNALGIDAPLITEHALYTKLGDGDETRSVNYRAIFDFNNIDKEERAIASATLRGEVLGNESFHARIAKLVSRATKLSSHGGDRKSDEYGKAIDNQAG